MALILMSRVISVLSLSEISSVHVEESQQPFLAGDVQSAFDASKSNEMHSGDASHIAAHSANEPVNEPTSFLPVQ